MDEQRLKLVFGFAKKLLDFTIGEDHHEAWKRHEHNFNINLYEYMQVYSKKDVSEIF
jgi:hypothetical protein